MVKLIVHAGVSSHQCGYRSQTGANAQANGPLRASGKRARLQDGGAGCASGASARARFRSDQLLAGISRERGHVDFVTSR